jgi:hypothetical protein
MLFLEEMTAMIANDRLSAASKIITAPIPKKNFTPSLIAKARFLKKLSRTNHFSYSIPLTIRKGFQLQFLTMKLK